MIIVSPFVSCVVTPDEFNEVISSGFYGEIYVEEKDRYLRYLRLSGGRYIKAPIKSKDLPEAVSKAIDKNEVSANVDMNFLPAGKIPRHLLGQIINFFREVSLKHKNEVEAHCWICWSSDKGYHIVVPEQVVSKAHLSYEYKEGVEAGKMIIVDIHSHNTMSAFFSGTDDNNDRNSINYSAVIGNLTPTSNSQVIRFNICNTKLKATFEDIFDDSELYPEGVKPEPAWLEKVKLPVQSRPATQLNKHRSAAQQSRKFYDQDELSEFWANMGNWTIDWALDGTGKPNLSKSKGRVSSMSESISKSAHITRLEKKLGLKPHEDIFELLEDYIGETSDFYAKIVDPRFHAWIEKRKDDDLEVVYGVDEDEAYEQIEAYLEDLTDCQEALVDLIRQIYALLNDQGRTELTTNGM